MVIATWLSDVVGRTSQALDDFHTRALWHGLKKDNAVDIERLVDHARDQCPRRRRPLKLSWPVAVAQLPVGVGDERLHRGSHAHGPAPYSSDGENSLTASDLRPRQPHGRIGQELTTECTISKDDCREHPRR